MNIVPLSDLCLKGDSKSEKSLKRLIEISCLDPGVELVLPVLGIAGLWEVDVNSIKDMHYRDFTFDDEDVSNHPPLLGTEAKKVNLDSVCSMAGQYYLALHQSSIDQLRRSNTGLACFFSSVKVVKEDGRHQEICPTNDNRLEGVFVLCDPEKNGTMLSIDDYGQLPLSKEILSVCVDPLSTECKDELLDIFPQLFRIPEYIQQRMKVIPKKYNKRPEKLELLISVYKKYWLSRGIEDLSGSHKEEINNKVSTFLLDGSPVNSEGDRIAGKKMLAFAVRVVVPDCFKKGRYYISHEIYSGVPIRLWILLCVAEFYWRYLDPDDISTHPEGVHIEKVLRCFGCESFPFSADILANVDKGDIGTTPYNDAWEDYMAIMREYPEIRFFPNVGFGSTYEQAASIVRPSWARAKSSGGGSGSYGERRSKGRENYISITSGKGDEDPF